mgnify:CR=1 FL=1|tara:strand:- start:1226 stop:1336 length:111 start_codon:yes stop_codon:yes gene_type:complete
MSQSCRVCLEEDTRINLINESVNDQDSDPELEEINV